MLNKNLSSNRGGFISLFLTVFIAISFLNLSPKTKLVESAQAQATTHPFLLVNDTEYVEMKTRANESPWKEMKADAISILNNYTYISTDPVYSTTNPPRTRHEEMINIVSSGALAYILEEDAVKKTAYKNKIRDTLLCWDNFWPAHAYPSNGWVDTVLKGSSFFNSVLALDIIYNDLTPEERTAIESRLAIVGDAYWNAMNPLPPKKPQSWGPNGWGCAGIWALYKNDTTRISTCATKYKNSILAWLQQDDGIMPAGTGYPGARFGGGRDAKAHFMDILEYTKTPPAFYTDTTFRSFFEWLYGYTITPFKKTYSFGDTQPDGAGLAPITAPHAGSIRDGSALFRAYKFSDAAGGYASWIYRGDPAKGTLLNYIFYTRKALEKLQSPVKPPSRIFKNGAWFLEDGSPTNTKLLAAAIWAPKNFDGHGHKEVNSLSLCAYGEHVLRGSGYLGAKVSGPAPFDWSYINYNALSGNTVFIDDAGHHGVVETAGKNCAGIVEGFNSNKLDYARGDSGSALTNGKHYRNFVFIHPQDGKNGYWLAYDEVIAATTGNHMVNVVLHPNSNSYAKISNQEYTFNIRNSTTVKLTTYLATAPGSVSLRAGYLAPGSFIGTYLYSSYPTDIVTKKKNIVTVLFPHDTTHAKANMSPISDTGFSGAKIDMGNYIIDTALESYGSANLTYNGVSFQGTAVWYRQNAGVNAGYFVRQGKSFKDGPFGFDSDNAVSIHIKDKSGKIVSPGTNVKFSYPGISAVYIDGIQITPTISVPGVSMTVTVPSGTHTVSFNLTGPITTAPPAFSPAAGTYPSAQDVSISTATTGATIYYTLDGSDPAVSQTRVIYSSPITISSTKTAKAKAFKTGLTPSITSQATYTINLSAAAAPTFSPAGGTYASAQNVTISTATTDATIHYTIDGTAPTEASSIYSTPIIISSNTTLKAGAWKTGMTPSTISSAAYTIGTLVNLAPNPGFETDPTVNYAYYGTGTFTWASDYFHTGAKSLKIVSSQASGQFARWVSKINNISVTAGKSYTASVWMKTSNVSQYGELLINFWDTNQAYLNTYYISNHVSATSNWTQLTTSGIAPANAKYVRAEFRLYGPGTIWIDDVELK